MNHQLQMSEPKIYLVERFVRDNKVARLECNSFLNDSQCWS